MKSDALITRLEAAKFGTRELDEEIALASGWTVREDSYGDNISEPVETWEVWEHPDFPLPEGDYYYKPPPFSTSLDAALTLVPEGWCLEYLKEALGPKRKLPCWWTRLFPALDDDEAWARSRIWDGLHRGRTGPLSLCIAALKARE